MYKHAAETPDTPGVRLLWTFVVPKHLTRPPVKASIPATTTAVTRPASDIVSTTGNSRLDHIIEWDGIDRGF
jgi:hypothetical protein